MSSPHARRFTVISSGALLIVVAYLCAWGLVKPGLAKAADPQEKGHIEAYHRDWYPGEHFIVRFKFDTDADYRGFVNARSVHIKYEEKTKSATWPKLKALKNPDPANRLVWLIFTPSEPKRDKRDGYGTGTGTVFYTDSGGASCLVREKITTTQL
jgi:hypothetical protein